MLHVTGYLNQPETSAKLADVCNFNNIIMEYKPGSIKEDSDKSEYCFILL